MNPLPQSPIAPQVDLRDMLRQYLITRSLACMEQAAERRRRTMESGDLDSYCEAVRSAVRRFYGTLPVGENGKPVKARAVSSFDKVGYRIENVLFESFPGWEVNATVYVPLDYDPPFSSVIVPVGHSGKQFASYQLPCQFFARAGYLAVTFDPPGQSGEKQPGNDHFIDGVRCYLIGETSSQYFVGDALRCIDYLLTRKDVDVSYGVAMTGVSGGGTTTTLAGLMDERVRVLGPSCCVTRLSDLDISQCYAGCPETHMWRRYVEGIDEIDLICAAVPKPVLLMAGEKDEVFRIGDTRRLAEEAKVFYARAGVEDRLEFYVDPGGHDYSFDQARQFTAFMDRWLSSATRKEIPDLSVTDFSLNPYEELRCYPRTDVNMRSLSLDRAKELRKNRLKSPETVRQSAIKIVGSGVPQTIPEAQVGEPFRIWTHQWQQVVLRPEPGIELPATFLYSENKLPTSTLLHFDDNGRHRHLAQNGILAQSVRFLDRERYGSNLFAVDLRGWGDTTITLYPYEVVGWGSTDRFSAYMSAALGDPVMAMRIRDGLSALAYVRSRPECAGENIVISGCGLGGMVAQHVAAIDGNVQGLVIWEALVSFEALLTEESYNWPADTFLPNVLNHYDLPELTASLSCPVRIFFPLNGKRTRASDDLLQYLQEKLDTATLDVKRDPATVVAEIHKLLERNVK